MNGKEQVKVMIESLELRLKQVKENKRDLDFDVLIYTPCPICKAMGLESFSDKNGDKKCSKCIAGASGVCVGYTDKVIEYDRTKLLQWLRHQIRKWKQIQQSADLVRKELEGMDVE